MEDNQKINKLNQTKSILVCNKKNSKVLTILSTVFLFVIAHTATLTQDQTACYYKDSKCDACYTLCSSQNITDLPYFVRQCLIIDTHINLELNSVVNFQNVIDIIFLIKDDQDKTNNCNLNNIKILQSDQQLGQFNISIRSGYLKNDQISYSINYNSQAQILNAQFQFCNLNYVEIQSIYFTGDKIQQYPALCLEQVLNSTVKNSIFSNITIQQNNGAAISLKQFTFMAIYNTLFEQNQLLYEYNVKELMGGTAIYLTDISRLKCYNCSFLSNDADCSLRGGVGGAIYLDNFSAIDTCQNCVFIKNKARRGGAIYLSENSLFSNCSNCIFDSNQGYDSGGAVSITHQSKMTLIFNTNFINNQQLRREISFKTYGGGAIYIEKSSDFSYSSECFFYNNYANSSGGAIQLYIDSTYSSSPNCFFIGNRALFNGGAILVYSNSKYIDSPNCTFKENNSTDGGAIHLSVRSIYNNSANCTFFKNNAERNGGSIYLFTQSVYSQSPYCIFLKNFAEMDGGAISLYQYSTYQDSVNVKFSNNSAKNGGAVSLTQFSNYFNSQNCKFENNQAFYIGGAIDLHIDSNYFNSPNCYFYQNIAIQGGAILLTQNCQYYSSPICIFENNFVKNNGGAIFFSRNSTYSESPDCSFLNNSAGLYGGALNFINSSYYLHSSNCQFFNNKANFGGGAISLQASSYIYGQNSNFSANQASKGGAMHLDQLSKYANSPNCLFFNNTAQNNGGAFFISDSSSYLDSPNTTFLQNRAFQFGGGIAVWFNNKFTLNIQEIKFENNTAYSGGAFYSDFSCNINIAQSVFINNIAQNGSGGALYFDQIKHKQYEQVQTNVINSQFIRNQAELSQGGAIFLKSNINFQNITIDLSIFMNNTALRGGAISLKYVQFPLLSSNIFIFNQAKYEGGALYSELIGFIYNYQEVNQSISITTFHLNINFYNIYEIYDPFLIQNNTFDHNQAQEVGGAIYLDYTQSQQEITNKFYRQVNNISEDNDITILNNSFCLVNNRFTNNIAQLGGAAIRINGFNMSMILDNSLNGSCAQTQRMIYDSRNENIFEKNTSPLFKYYTPQQFQSYEKIHQEEILCSCLYGEKLSQNPVSQAYFCQKCEQNTYIKQYYDNLTENYACIECPNGFICPGGYQNLRLKQNFWSHTSLSARGNYQTFEAYPCNIGYQNKHTCIGYDDCLKSTNLCSDDSVCQINFMGPACQVCNERLKYYPSGQNSCQKCRSGTFVILKLVGTVIIILVLLYVSISSTIRKIQKQILIKSLRIGFDEIIVDKDQLTALIRIVTNYFQNISYFFLLSVQVPDYVSQFFLFVKNIGQPLQSFSSSFECLTDQYYIEGITKKQQYLLFQFLWSLTLPTVIIILLYLGSFIVQVIFQKKIGHPIYLLIAPTYIYLYLEFLPTLFYNSLSFLTCRQIAGRKYVIGDSQYECQQLEHGVQSLSNLSIALPIFLFEMFIPLVLVSVLVIVKNKNLMNRPLTTSSCKYQLGYFYLGYKKSCYYWEFLRIFQRLLIATTFLIFYDYNSQKGALVAMILVSYSLLANHLKPNENIIVQTAEFYSNHVQIYTFISAVLLQQFTYDWFQYIILIAITAFNIMFIIFMLNQMLSTVKTKLIIVLMKYKFFQRFKFVRYLIQNYIWQRIVVKKWLILKRQLREVIKFGHKNSIILLQDKDSLLKDYLLKDYQKQEEQYSTSVNQKSQSVYKQFSQDEIDSEINNSEQTEAEQGSLKPKIFFSQKQFSEISIN